jgi:hypothetical protein
VNNYPFDEKEQNNTTCHLLISCISLSLFWVVLHGRLWYNGGAQQDFGQGGVGRRGGASTGDSHINSSLPAMVVPPSRADAAASVRKYMNTY